MAHDPPILGVLRAGTVHGHELQRRADPPTLALVILRNRAGREEPG